MKAIEARNVTKLYGNFKAVDGISFDVEEGEIFGLLGPNGAGKSTTINMAIGLLSITSGTIKVLGKDVSKDWYGVKRQIGHCFGFSNYMGNLTGRENLTFYGYLYGMEKRHIDESVDELCRTIGFKEIDKKASSYSSGMVQKLSLVKALLNDPKLILVDELTVGLDVDAARDIRRVLKDARDNYGKTVLLTTHYMQEADELCDRIGLISHGKLVMVGTPKELKKSIKQPDLMEIETTNPEKALAAVKGLKGVQEAVLKNSVLHLKVDSSKNTMHTILDRLMHANLTIMYVNVKGPTMEDVFMEVKK